MSQPARARHPGPLALIALTALAAVRLPAETLTTAQQVRLLSAEEAAHARPLRVSGVVTAPSGWRNSFFFQDDTAGISVDREDTEPEVRAGDHVEIEGVSAPGLFAPVIHSRRVRLLGRRALPPAPELRFHELLGGRHDSRWIEVRGVVRAAGVAESWGHPVLFLTIAMEGGVLEARVREFADAAASLVDAEVRLRGVCGTRFNDRRQFVGLRLFVNSLADVEVLRAPPLEPYAVPLRPLASLLGFDPSGSAGHRIRVGGVVTFQKRGRYLHVQEGSESVLVETDQDTPVAVGSRVEGIGFPTPGPYSPALASASFRVVGPAIEPEPIVVDAARVIARSPEDFLVAPYDGLLVKVRGHLVEHLLDGADGLLLLRSGPTLFRARLPGSASVLEPGSVVEATGVCAVRTDQHREPTSFELQMRSPADLAVIEAPPFWNRRRTLFVLALSGAGAVLALGWVAALRRRVKVQTGVIEQQVAILRQSEERFRQLAENVDAVFFVRALHPDRILYVSPACERLFGRPAPELLANPESLAAVAIPEDREAVREAMRRAARGEACDIEYRVVHPDGSLRWVHTRAFPVRNDHGEVARVAGIADDVSERRRAERLRDDLTHTLVHDLKTPLTAILGCLDLLGMASERRDPEDVEAIAVVRNNAVRLLDLVDTILDVSRLEAGAMPLEPAPVEVAGLVAETLALQRPTALPRRLELQVDVPAGLAVRGDRALLGRVLQNLVGNAIKFTPDGGRVRVEAAIADDPRFVAVAVSDSGRGIPEEFRGRLFEKFASGSHAGRGSGLGLLFCRLAADAHGGRIRAEDNEPRGTRFVLTLPRIETP